MTKKKFNEEEMCIHNIPLDDYCRECEEEETAKNDSGLKYLEERIDDPEEYDNA